MSGSSTVVDDERVARALANPVRLDVLGYLIAAGPATASRCARALGDTPSNCSYHLRLLAEAGLVEPTEPGAGRRRPWRATVASFSEGEHLAASTLQALLTASMQLDMSLAREHLRTRDELPDAWRDVEAHGSFGLMVTPEELRRVIDRIEAMLRPLRAGSRTDPPTDASHAHVTFTAFPRRSWADEPA